MPMDHPAVRPSVPTIASRVACACGHEPAHRNSEPSLLCRQKRGLADSGISRDPKRFMSGGGADMARPATPPGMESLRDDGSDYSGGSASVRSTPQTDAGAFGPGRTPGSSSSRYDSSLALLTKKFVRLIQDVSAAIPAHTTAEVLGISAVRCCQTTRMS